MTEVTATQADREVVQVIQDCWFNRDKMAEIVARHRQSAEIAAIEEAKEACAKLCDERGAEEQEGFGLVRSAQNYFRARNAIRALSAHDIQKGLGR